MQFIFDVNSQHQFTAPQSVVYTTDLTNGPYVGFGAQLIAVNKAISPSSLVVDAINGTLTIDAASVAGIRGKLHAGNFLLDYKGSGGFSLGGAPDLAVVNGVFQNTTGTGGFAHNLSLAQFRGTYGSTSNYSSVFGGMWLMSMAATATCSNIMNGLNVAMGDDRTAGNLIQYSGITISMRPTAGGGTYTDVYGSFITFPTNPIPAVTAYGQKIGDVTGGTTNYSQYLSKGNAYYGGSIVKHRSTFSNVAYAQDPNDLLIVQIGTLTASRALQLLAANTLLPGTIVTVVDESGSATAVNTIVVTRAGADTINGAATASIVLGYGVLRLMTDGVSKWTLI